MIVPPVIAPSDTASAPRHMTIVIPPKISTMTIEVIAARSRMRRFALSKVRSTTPAKRFPSRASWPKLWTMDIALSTSVT